MKFKFECAIVVEAAGEEEALNKVAQHVATVARHAGSGRDLPAAAVFKVTKQADTAAVTDLSDTVVAEHGPVDLSLDPESAAGVALVKQKEDEAAAAEAAAKANERDTRSDAEVMADHAAREQQTLGAGDVGKLSDVLK